MENRESLMDFFESYCDQFNAYPRENLTGCKILDAGCGLGAVSFALAARGAEVTGADISELAIMGAKSIARNMDVDIEFKVADLTSPNLKLGQFDVIVDSHLFHCLTSVQERKNYLSFINNNLKPDGRLFLESMVYHNHLEVPMDYHLDENLVLHQYFTNDKKFVPVRMLADSITIEQEIKDSGLNLSYFYYHAELVFQVFTDYKNYPHSKLPHTIRAVAIKKAD